MWFLISKWGLDLWIWMCCTTAVTERTGRDMIWGAFLCSIQVPIHQHIFNGCGQRSMCVSIYIYIYIYIYIKILHWALWRKLRSVPWFVLYLSIRSVKKTCETGSLEWLELKWNFSSDHLMVPQYIYNIWQSTITVAFAFFP